MYFLKSIIDILIILLLLRLLISPNGALFNPIYRLIYRITDVLLTPSKFIARKPTQGILVTVLALVILRGTIYISIKPMPFMSAVGISLLGLFQLLFQFYMVILIVSVLSRRSFATPFTHIIDRAFLPVRNILSRFRIQRDRFYLFSFFFLWITYSILSTIILFLMISQTGFSPVSVIHVLAEGLMLVLALFPFPGFFSLVIIIGALLSWVSPDPSNPIVQAIYGIGEPLLAPFRRIIPHIGGLDISPILALLCFHILGVAGRQLIGSLVRAILP
ncbi:MAG: YggT family protein [Deltaproteobacteria bacterium]|nr:YggT family protein [Deltaproteobacteria bacterium]